MPTPPSRSPEPLNTRMPRISIGACPTLRLRLSNLPDDGSGQ
jgi:hypothetical protein